MRFLTSHSILEAVKNLVGEEGDLLIAVAYWGDGAVEQTGIAHRGDGRARVLCDLLSGACNPDEIAALLELGVEVRTLRGMHAKVWANGDHVIVGSANASMNGLGFEANFSLVPNVEAAVQFRDRTIAEQVQEWVDRIWDLASSVNEEMLTYSRGLWRRKQTLRGISQVVMEHRILAYCVGEYSSQAMDLWIDNRESLYTQDELAQYEQDGLQPFYEMGPEWAHLPERGIVFLDFTCEEEHGDFNFGDSWKITHDPVTLDNGNILVFVSRIRTSRFPIPRQAVSQMVMCWVTDNGWQPRPEFGDTYLDMNFAEFFFGKKGDCLDRRNANRCDACPFRD